MQAALRQMYRILLGREHVPEGITPAFIADRLPPLPARYAGPLQTLPAARTHPRLC
jgi:hypothetical protein